MGIGQNLLLAKLATAVPSHTRGAVSAPQVLAAGATGLGRIAPSAEVLRALRAAYAEAVRGPLLLALAAACLAFPPAATMERLNIREVAEGRRRRREEERKPSAGAGEETKGGGTLMVAGPRASADGKPGESHA